MSIVQLTNSWISLAIAILFGVLGTLSLKLSHGFTNTRHIFPVLVFYTISFIAMTYAVIHLELSVVYAVWSGVGTLLATLVGFYQFKEPISFKKIIYILLIIIGVVGIHLNAFT